MAKINHREAGHAEIVGYGVVAGLAGGFAEIAWVTLYAGLTGGSAAIVARSVTTAVGLRSLFPALPVTFGVLLHMALAVGLGIALAFAWRVFSANRSEAASPFPFVITALAGVWTVNFLVVLPLVSPAFLHLMPYSVSLISKLLFGLAAAEAFRRQDVSTRYASPQGFAPSPS